jgi:hypothetical protein
LARCQVNDYCIPEIQNQFSPALHRMKKNTIAHEWFDEVWNKRQTATIDRLLADDVIPA